MSRTAWTAPGRGTNLKELAIFLGRYVPPAVTDDQLEAPTSLLLLDEGIADERDKARLEEVVRRVLEHGKDGGW